MKKLLLIAVLVSTFHFKNTGIIETPGKGLEHSGSHEIEQPQTKQLQPVDDQAITYSLQNNALHITFDQGESWKTVPIEKHQLFNERHRGSKEELLDHSYVLTKERAAFIYWENGKVFVVYSLDQGETWEEAVVVDAYPLFGFGKVDFITDEFGYVLLTGERVVAQEQSNFYVTSDGGRTWGEINHPEIMSLVQDGGFVDEDTVFLSVGSFNPDKPNLHVSQDGGTTWSEAEVNVPKEYEEIFLIAEMPTKEEEHLEMLVNQGPNGDYKGGIIKGKFISTDHGGTWEFVEEIEITEIEPG